MAFGMMLSLLQDNSREVAQMFTASITLKKFKFRPLKGQ